MSPFVVHAAVVSCPSCLVFSCPLGSFLALEPPPPPPPAPPPTPPTLPPPPPADDS